VRITAVLLLSAIALTAGCGSGTPLPTVQQFELQNVADLQAQNGGYLAALNNLMLRQAGHLAYLEASAPAIIATRQKASPVLRQLPAALEDVRSQIAAIPPPPAERLAVDRLGVALHHAALAARAIETAIRTGRSPAAAIRRYRAAAAAVNHAVARLGPFDDWRGPSGDLLRGITA
jgi:hypothetical protein